MRIFLADGSATGVRFGEIVNWTGQAVACPRNRFPELREWQETRRTGVYFLFGSDENDRNAAYIGEAEDVFERIRSHVQDPEKDYWNELIAFTSKDDNLTKAHVKFLEFRLHELACAAGQYIVRNSNTPQAAGLPRADRDAMQEFIEGIRVLLGVFGHRLLDSPVPRRVGPPTAEDQPPSIEPLAHPASADTSGVNQTFVLRSAGITARAVQTDEGLVVLSGSEAAKQDADGFKGGYKLKRERLLTEGVLQDAGANLRFSRDYAFPSPSQAAAVVVGYSINGQENWRTESGQTYKQFEQLRARQLAVPDNGA